MTEHLSQEDFLKVRVDDQIDWYDTTSQANQRWYKRLRVAEIVAAASIPFLAGYISPDMPWTQVVAGLLGCFIAVAAAVISLYQFQDNWIEYRTTCESLRHEKFLFLTKTEPYNVETPFPLLVQRVESLISTENTKWSQHIKTPRKEK